MKLLAYALSLTLAFFQAAPAFGDLTADVQALLRDKTLAKADVGVEIIDLRQPDKPKPVFKHDSDIPLIPASNLKLVTTAAALEKLGPDFKFRTLLVQNGDDLVLVGDGDPTFGDAELLKKAGWSADTVFKNWAQGLGKSGINTINNVMVDDSVFDQVFTHPNWPTDQLHKRYVAQVGGVNLNANCVDFYLKIVAFGQRVDYRTVPQTSYVSVANECIAGEQNAVWLSRVLGGNSIVLKGQTNRSSIEPVSVTIHDPPLFAATVLADTLNASGVNVSGKITRDRSIRARLKSDSTLRILAVHETPISEVLRRANKDSMNLYAESLCKRLGFAATSQPGSWENGTAAMKQFLVDSGVSESEFTLDDGCGLSKKNAISANALTRMLANEFRGKNRAIFLSSLAVGGADGTLDKRFRDGLKGRVFAKSGYVNAVSCLSGYVKTSKGNWYAFSILMNKVTSGQAKTIQEKIVAAIDKND